MPREFSRDLSKEVRPHAPDLSTERMRVLEMLEQGKITAAEAAELLRALGEDVERPDREEPARRERPHWFRVRVTEVASGRQKANVSIPFGMVNFGLRFAPGNFRFRGKGMPRQVDDLLDALRSGRRGTLYDITDKNEGERIEIIVE
ncbi:MAG TPA: hypothetical protein VIO16_08580 [Dehalococcoidia bacterium]